MMEIDWEAAERAYEREIERRAAYVVEWEPEARDDWEPDEYWDDLESCDD